MDLEKYILAVITTNKNKVAAGTGVFYCDSKQEMETVTANLEAILDGIAHGLSEDLYIIVKH
ncbi:capping complex subunit for YIEGIA [Mesobacillus maritimus]|uniref:capping complex subunit for YIEGIA n=1 Tax=Mesobacillus maritimus TaxID=1643336 RepID=UPI00384F4627